MSENEAVSMRVESLLVPDGLHLAIDREANAVILWFPDGDRISYFSAAEAKDLAAKLVDRAEQLEAMNTQQKRREP